MYLESCTIKEMLTVMVEKIVKEGRSATPEEMIKMKEIRILYDEAIIRERQDLKNKSKKKKK